MPPPPPNPPLVLGFDSITYQCRSLIAALPMCRSTRKQQACSSGPCELAVLLEDPAWTLLRVPGNHPPTHPPQPQPPPTTHHQQVLDPPCRYGLWVILGAGLLLGLVAMLFARRRQRKLKFRNSFRASIGPGKVSNHPFTKESAEEADVEAGRSAGVRQEEAPPSA